MEIYYAVSDFESPSGEGSQNILSFDKGERFEIHDCHKQGTEWWGAKSLKNNNVGYVPSKYMKFEKRIVESLLPDSYTEVTDINRMVLESTPVEPVLADIQSMEGHPPVGHVTPETPLPDYDEEEGSQPEPRQFRFVRQFSNVINSIRSIDEMYPDVPEPEPDYLDDDDVIDSGNNRKISDSVNKLTRSLNEQVILRERKTSNSDLDKRLSDPGNDDLLIKPRKLSNPCLASPARIAVHKELLHNYKVGKNILEKPELDKVLEKVKEKQRVQEWESHKKSNKRTSLEMKLEQQARHLQEQEDAMKPITEKEEESQSELSRMQSKILHKPVNGSAVK